MPVRTVRWQVHPTRQAPSGELIPASCLSSSLLLRDFVSWAFGKAGSGSIDMFHLKE